MSTTLYGEDVGAVLALLQRIQEEREAIDALKQMHASENYQTKVEETIHTLYASELVCVYQRRIVKLGEALALFGIAVEQESARPSKIDGIKRSITINQGETA